MSDEIVRGIAYEPIAPQPPYHTLWWRLDLAPPAHSPSACQTAFMFWLGERALYGN